MTGWTWQAWLGLIGGTLVFLGVLIPMCVVQLRRYGQTSLPRLLGAAAVSIYATALMAYTLFPLPDAIANCAAGASALELIPGHSFGDIARDSAGLSPFGILTSHATLQVVMNVALFVPFGMMARRYWNRGPAVSILLGALLSLLIEATQGTGIWGMYECAYRVADVDDLIANTAGTAIGVIIAPALLTWMPSARSLRAARGAPRRVTVWRRWLGMVLDAFLAQVAISLFSFAFLLPRLIAAGGHGPGGPEGIAEVLAIGACSALLVIIFPSLLGNGASLGQRLVWLMPRWHGSKSSAARRLFRGSAVTLPYLAASTAQQLPDAASGTAQTVAGIIGIVSSVIVFCAVVSVPLTRGHRGLSLAMAGAELGDSREKPTAARSETAAV